MGMRSQTLFIAHPDRDPGSPLQGREQPGGLDTVSTTRPTGAWSFASYGGPRSVQVCQSDLERPSSRPAPMGPLKPLPHHLPSFCLSGWMLKRNLQRKSTGCGVGGRRGVRPLQGRPPHPVARVNTLSCQNVLKSGAVAVFFGEAGHVFGFIFGVFLGHRWCLATAFALPMGRH